MQCITICRSWVDLLCDSRSTGLNQGSSSEWLWAWDCNSDESWWVCPLHSPLSATFRVVQNMQAPKPNHVHNCTTINCTSGFVDAFCLAAAMPFLLYTHKPSCQQLFFVFLQKNRLVWLRAAAPVCGCGCSPRINGFVWTTVATDC